LIFNLLFKKSAKVSKRSLKIKW